MPKDSDQPSVYTTVQVKEIYSHDMYAVRQIGRAKKGSQLLVPFSDGSTVGYLFDGEDLWHRADTKMAQVIRNTAKRQVIGRG